jgi:hypothetical protein
MVSDDISWVHHKTIEEDRTRQAFESIKVLLGEIVHQIEELKKRVDNKPTI